MGRCSVTEMILEGVGRRQVDVRARRSALWDVSRGGKCAFDGGCEEPSKTVREKDEGRVNLMERLNMPGEDRGG